MKKCLLLLAILCLIMPALYAQSVILDAQVRPRAEFRNGFKALSPDRLDPAFFIEQRTRINALYSSEKVKLKLSFQDVRIWGATSQIYKSDPSLFNVFEAWGQFYFSPEFSFKAGRMPIAYHNERFMGALGWAAQGRSHDALQLLYRKNGLKIDVGLAFNQRVNEPTALTGTFYPATNNYKSMQYIHFAKKLEKSSITAIIHNDGKQVQADSTTAFRQTLGLTLDQKTDGDLSFGGELYYQMGKDERDVDVSALFVSGYLTLNTEVTPITLAVDYASGSKDYAAKNESWNPLYGTNHKFYGWMDYFYVGNSHNNVGLIDMRVLTKFKTGEKTSLQTRIHYFMSAVDIVNTTNPAQSMSSALGTEVDLVLNWNPHEFVAINLGYSQLFATDSMEVLKGGSASSINNWAWLQVNFTPVLAKWDINKSE